MDNTIEIVNFLEKKYGKHITNKLVKNGKVLLENISIDDNVEQQEVMKHIENLCDESGAKLLPANFLENKVEWGVDFSSWLGKLDSHKKFMFIGAEPHLSKNYQLVYDFGSQRDKSTEKSATEHYERDDIWQYLTKIFVQDLKVENITAFLNQCYITDLCPIVPKNCGQVNSILKKLGREKAGEWNKFRTKMGKTFLPEEIKVVNPEFIILHGNVAREFFKKELKVTFNIGQSPFNIVGSSKFKIRVGKFEGHTVIAIPHLKGQVRNELWKSKKYPERYESATKILRELVK